MGEYINGEFAERKQNEKKTRRKWNQPQQEWHASNRITNNIILFMSDQIDEQKKFERFFGYDFIFALLQFTTSQYELLSGFSLKNDFTSVVVFEVNFNHAVDSLLLCLSVFLPSIFFSRVCSSARLLVCSSDALCIIKFYFCEHASAGLRRPCSCDKYTQLIP